MAGVEVTCIRATRADLLALGAWMHAFYAEEGLGSPRVEALEALVGDAGLGCACVLHTGEGPAGYLVLTWGYSLERGGKIAILDELFILPGFRNRGIGRRGVDAAARLAGAAGCRAVLLEVDVTNEVAGRLYRRAGFAAPGREVLVLPLTPAG